MKELILEAINERNVLQFVYEGEKRMVEPFILGKNKDTNCIVVRAYCLDAKDWFLLEVDKMIDLTLTNLVAEDFREHYNPVDLQMARIFCNL